MGSGGFGMSMAHPQTAINNPTLAAAEYLASKGHKLFPLQCHLKTPATSDGFKSATTDPAKLAEWFGGGAKYNIGLATGGGLLVLDLDTKGGDGRAELAALEEVLGKVPDTLTVSTPSGGEHLYFRYAAELDIRSSAKQLAGNVDVRANGGYVVAPPSHTDAAADPKNRTCTGDYTISKKLPIADLPPAWVDRLTTKHPRKPTERTAYTPSTPAEDYQQLADLQAALGYIDPTPYDSWVAVGGALHALGDGGFALWDTWSKGGGNYDASVMRKHWASFAGLSLSAPKVFGMAADRGWVNPAKGKRPEPEARVVPPTPRQHPAAHGEKKPEPLPSELPPVMTLDFAWLPDVMGDYVKEASEQMNSPPDFLAVTLLVAAATVIGRRIGVRPQGETDWVEFCNAWGLLIGRPGVMKSPTMGVGLRPLYRLINQANKKNDDARKEWEARQAISKMRVEANKAAFKKILAKDPSAVVDAAEFVLDDDDPPPAKRYMTSDATVEAMLEVLRSNENGIMVFRDEIIGLLKGMDREDRAEQRAIFLTGWNGNSHFTSDRIGRGLNLNVEAVCLSVLGATQPGKVAAYVRQAVQGGEGDDGLLQRFSLTVWPDVGAYVEVDRPPDKAKLMGINYLFDYLDEMKPEDVQAVQDVGSEGKSDGVPYLRFDAEALAIFRDWRTDLENRLRSDELHPALESHLAKYRKMIPGLALVLHLADRQKGSIGVIPLLQAIKLAGYFESHAVRLYSSVAMPEVEAAKLILRKLKAGEIPQPFKARDIYRKHWAGLDKPAVEDAIALLLEYGWLDESSEDTAGRPALVYALSAGAHGA